MGNWLGGWVTGWVGSVSIVLFAALVLCWLCCAGSSRRESLQSNYNIVILFQVK